MRLSAFVTSFATLCSYSSWSYSRSKSSLTFMMSGSAHPLSVKYSILRSTSESGIFSRCASSTIWEMRNSLASRPLWNTFMWRILLLFQVDGAHGGRNIVNTLTDPDGQSPIDQILLPHPRKLLQLLLPVLRDPPRILPRYERVIHRLIGQQGHDFFNLEIRRIQLPQRRRQL